MVKKSEIFHSVKSMIVKQNVLRAFTAICVSAITAMSAILIWFATYWGTQMEHHTDQLNIIITQNSTIIEHQKNQDDRINDNRENIKTLLTDNTTFKIFMAKNQK